MPQVFISYRRSDSAAEAKRLAAALATHLGADAVFLDVAGIQPGANFDSALDGALQRAQIALVLIGPRWMDELRHRQTLAERDFVHLEVAGALQAGLRVVPVLVGTARLPATADLPEALQALTRRQAVELPDSGWDKAVDQLATSIGKPYRWGALALRVGAVVGVVLPAVYFMNTGVGQAQRILPALLGGYAAAELGAAAWRWQRRRWRA